MYATSDGPRDAHYRSAFEALGRGLTGFMTKIADAEPVVAYLVRMGWVQVQRDDSLRLTDLGARFLEALRVEPQTSQLQAPRSGVVTVLAPEDEDPLVYANLTGAIAKAGEGLLVDPYVKADLLDWLLNATRITRLLVYRKASDVTAIAMTLHAMGDAMTKRLSIRATKSRELHDRCVIADDGQVLMLGTSLTGVGEHLSVIYPLPDTVAPKFRTGIEKIWASAEQVEPQPLRQPIPPVADIDTPATPDGAVPDDGRE